MVDPVDDIARQARQGSVSAIIQVLNDKLADSGVRTRAIFAGGVLQLLCEAAKPEQLEQPMLVDRIRQILESLQPRSIRRVNINSRIVREQQLLWLDEVNRDPKSQLLWSEEITLAKANPLKRVFEDWSSDKSEQAKALPKTARGSREKRQFWRGILGGVSLSLLLLIIGWVVADWLGLKPGARLQAVTTPAAEESSPEESLPSPVASPSPPPQQPQQPQQDPFVQAVRLAEQAVRDGQTAASPADWLDLATRWQRASDLMAQVPSNDGRYKTAQDRIQAYSANSKAALAQAEKQRQGGQPQQPGVTSPSPKPSP